MLLAILHVPFCLAAPGNGPDMTLNAPFAGHALLLLAAHSHCGQNFIFCDSETLGQCALEVHPC